MKEFKLPELGENITSATVVKVLINPGDFIENDQTVLEIETDKATIEVPSTISGKVVEVRIKEGDKAEVGSVVFVTEEQEAKPLKEGADDYSLTKTEKVETIEEIKTGEISPAKIGSSEVSFLLPELGENIASATVINVLVKVGDFIEKEQAVLEIETDKATIEVPSTVSGKITEVLVKEGDKASVGSIVFKALGSVSVAEVVKKEIADEKKSEQKVEQANLKPETIKTEATKPLLIIDSQPPILQNSAPAAPSVRRLAREIGVDINQIKGTGVGNRITLDDVKAYSKMLHHKRGEMQQSVSYEAGYQPLPDFAKYGNIDIQPMNNIRIKTAEHLSYAWHTIPHVTQFDKADITELEVLRKSYAKKLEKQGVKLTITAILVKIVTSAMKVFPQFNSSIDMQKKEVIYKKYFNIGIAVDTERGLIVPVIKNSDSMNVIQISNEINMLAEKSRNRKISLEELQGGCFTITNLGGFGGTAFTPIVNSPEVAILGVSRGVLEPVYKEGKFEPRLMLPLSLSYDHRVIDGADGIRFLRWVVEALENPMKLLIEG